MLVLENVLSIRINNYVKEGGIAMFKSNVFEVRKLTFRDSKEQIVVGGRDKLPLLSRGFGSVRQIGIIGWGSQGPAQAQDLRDSLKGTGINVKVGLRRGSPSLIKACRVGFTEENNTLGEMYSVIAESDMVILLIADSGQVDEYKKIFSTMKKGATLGLSHGFLLGHLRNVGEYFPDDINVVGVCPKGMGPSVRRLYEQGSGINASFAVECDINGHATDIALSWATALGAPSIFWTTLEMEYRSDIFGERGILLGAPNGIVEALYYIYCLSGLNRMDAYGRSVENITGPISRIISKEGIVSVYNSLDSVKKATFNRMYMAAYRPSLALLSEIYDEVENGNEIKSVVMAGKRMKEFPMGEIDKSDMWNVVGKAVREKRSEKEFPVDPTTAGLYCAVMMAQIDLLMKKGHCMSEICNESVIEAVDSLNPYMHHAGIAHMIDNCSTTARLGARKWGPRFFALIMQEIYPSFKDDVVMDKRLMDTFMDHPVHDALEICGALRPPIDISL